MSEEFKKSFYRDTMHNYLVIECRDEMRENYQYKMLAANSIRGLLPCSSRSIDQQEYLYYDITSRQSLADLYDRRPVRGEDLQRLLEDLVRITGTLSEYLLDASHLILDPSCVYVDFREREAWLAYYPGGLKQEGWLQLFSFLADRVDGSDKQASAAVYRLCMMAENPGFRMEKGLIRELGLGSGGEGPAGLLREKDRQGGGAPLLFQDAPAFPREAPKEPYQGEAFRGWAAAIEERGSEEKTKERDMDREQKKSGGSKKGGKGKPVLGSVLFLAGTALFSAGMLCALGEREKLLLCAGGGLSLAAGLLLLLMWLIGKRRQDGDEKAAGAEAEEAESMGEPELSFAAAAAFKGMEVREGPAVPAAESVGRAAPAFGETCLLSPGAEHEAGLYGTGVCRGERISLSNLPCVVGKVREYVDQVLDDSTVSRMHARFSIDRDGAMTVRDLNSTNGTWLNGERLAPNETRRIRQGDHIRLGRMEFVYR